MEWSESHDAWDDPGDDRGDGDAYPPAPLPAHERAWRHPSEVGQATWVLTEPPVTIGRGLLVTTGAVGCVLGVAVLWLLVPIGGGLAPSASPTATSAVVARALAPTTAPETIERFAATSAPRSSVVTSLSPTTSAPPMVVTADTVMVQARQVEQAPQSIAVAIANTPYIVTTAAAVSGTDGVSLFTADGTTVDTPEGGTDGSVVAVEGGLAYIEPSTEMEVLAFGEVAVAEPGQLVTVLSDDSELTVAYTGDEVAELDGSIIVEGTPVIDDDGALVALCTVTIDADGATVRLVPIDVPEPPADTVATADSSAESPATSATDPTTSAVIHPTAWIGVRLGGVEGADELTVTSVAAGSPAEAAGLQIGDQIVAVDGVALATVDEVLLHLATKVPGDSLAVTVAAGTAPGSPERTVSVVLGASEATV